MNIKTCYRCWCFLIVCFLITSCSAPSKLRTVNFKPTTFENVDGWEDDSHSKALVSFKKSCEKILLLDAESSISRATSLGGSAIDWQVPCMEAQYLFDINDKQAKVFFEKWFKPYLVFDDSWNNEGLLTGYYQIELEGSKRKHGKFKYPLYRKPKHLEKIKGTSDIEHAAINNGVLKGLGLEFAYVDNPFRLYFMQIQGSGIIKLKEGGYLNIGFEGHNGYKFQGISKALKKRDLKFDNAKSMINYLQQNPVDGRNIIEQDPSFVFFRPLEGVHAVGGQGVKLHPERSLAVDYGLYPYGTPIWIASNLPQKSIFNGREYKRLFIAQDTGGAIRGAIRGDIFFGRGDSAEKVANNFKAKGKFFAFFPKTVSIPESYTSR